MLNDNLHNFPDMEAEQEQNGSVPGADQEHAPVHAHSGTGAEQKSFSENGSGRIRVEVQKREQSRERKHKNRSRKVLLTTFGPPRFVPKRVRLYICRSTEFGEVQVAEAKPPLTPDDMKHLGEGIYVVYVRNAETGRSVSPNRFHVVVQGGNVYVSDSPPPAFLNPVQEEVEDVEEQNTDIEEQITKVVEGFGLLFAGQHDAAEEVFTELEEENPKWRRLRKLVALVRTQAQQSAEESGDDRIEALEEAIQKVANAVGSLQKTVQELAQKVEEQDQNRGGIRLNLSRLPYRR